MAKEIHEIWKTGTGFAMFRRGAKGWRKSLDQSASLLHTFEAESPQQAFNAYYKIMGWGEWTPPPGYQDEPYPGKS